jgi:hypothetical protein
MLLEIKCSVCGESKYMILDVTDNGMALICKNVNCDAFNCYTDFNQKYLYREMNLHNETNKEITIKEAFTGEVEFEDDDGIFKEIYTNGVCDNGFKQINGEWVNIKDIENDNC